MRKFHEAQGEAGLEAIENALRAEIHEFIKLPCQAKGNIGFSDLRQKAARRMSACGGMIREKNELKTALETTCRELNQYLKLVKRPAVSQLPVFYRLRDMLLSQKIYLSAMLDYCEHGAGSRGSALYTDRNGRKPDAKMPDLYQCRLDQGAHAGMVQEIMLDGTTCRIEWRPVRPIPEVDYFFENQWKAYRKREGTIKNID